jgi:hypothetical protein
MKQHTLFTRYKQLTKKQLKLAFFIFLHFCVFSFFFFSLSSFDLLVLKVSRVVSTSCLSHASKDVVFAQLLLFLSVHLNGVALRANIRYCSREKMKNENAYLNDLLNAGLVYTDFGSL